jgi:hypothetical protein
VRQENYATGLKASETCNPIALLAFAKELYERAAELRDANIIRRLSNWNRQLPPARQGLSPEG